jgi:predicted patatin/cPLA2 family phospholipase
MTKVALVLQGGSLRSLYTAGVLDVFMENNIEFACVIGVSAGALCGANYIAKHIGNTAKINIFHSNDSNFFGIRQFLFKGSVFNFDYLFYKPIKELYPYNEEKLINSEKRFLIGATDCATGKAVYFEAHNYSELVIALRASSSMPLLCKPVNMDGILYLDGGIADPIGVHKAFSEGFDKVVLVLTRHAQYREPPLSKLNKFFIKIYNKKYPKLMATLKNRPQQYNRLIEEIEVMESENKIVVIRPSYEVKIKKLERDARKLARLYLLGRDDAREILPKVNAYIN